MSKLHFTVSGNPVCNTNGAGKQKLFVAQTTKVRADVDCKTCLKLMRQVR